MLVIEAQEEDGCDSCVPIKSKWQSDLGEAEGGYIFSQSFSQGSFFFSYSLFSFFPAILIFFPAPMWAAWLAVLFRDASLQSRAPETIRPLHWESRQGELNASHHSLFWQVFSQAMSIKGLFFNIWFLFQKYCVETVFFFKTWMHLLKQVYLILFHSQL